MLSTRTTMAKDEARGGRDVRPPRVAPGAAAARSGAGATALSPGDQIGNYIIERRLGSGGQAEVFLARDVVLRRPVALKVGLERAGAASQAQSVSGVEEARLIAQLDHPNI